VVKIVIDVYILLSLCFVCDILTAVCWESCQPPGE